MLKLPIGEDIYMVRSPPYHVYMYIYIYVIYIYILLPPSFWKFLARRQEPRQNVNFALPLPRLRCQVENFRSPIFTLVFGEPNDCPQNVFEFLKFELVEKLAIFCFFFEELFYLQSLAAPAA